MTEKKTSRCWPGYEPVPGKAPHEKGSCRPQAKSSKAAKPATKTKKRSKT